MIWQLGEARRSVHVVDPDRTCKNEASSQLVCAADMETMGSDGQLTIAHRLRRRVAAGVVLQPRYATRMNSKFPNHTSYSSVLILNTKLTAASVSRCPAGKKG